jgi:chromosome segregation protein
MFLKRLEIYGFKSFGTKSILDFEDGKIAGVVGPNGSGKSNVADAIRWVLGEQSTNLLRSKKGEDVVFVGSQKKARSSYAEVALLLSGDTEVEVEIAGKKHKFNNIEITRKIYRSGEGEYLINRKKVRLLDLQTLLASLGFGQSSYTVIGQGMVDRLLFFNAAERRVLFDEAAGVKQYKIKRGQAIKRLQTTEENLIRLKDIGQELSPRVQNLRRLVKKAEGRLTTEKELTEAEQKYYGSLLGELKDNISKLNLKKEGFLAKVKYLESEKETVGGEGRSDLPQDLTNRQCQFESELGNLQKQRDESMKEISFIEGQLREQENFFYNLKNNQVNMTKEETRLETEREKQKKAIEGKRKELTELAVRLTALEQELETLSKEAETKTKTAIEENGLLAEFESRRLVLEKELSRFEGSEKLQKNIAKENETRKLRLAREVAELNAKLKEKEKSREAEAVRAERLKGEIVIIENGLQKAFSQIKKIEEEIAGHRERVNPENLKAFNLEIKKLKENHSIFSGHVEKGSSDLKNLFADFSRQFDRIIRLTKQFTEAIDPVLREKLEGDLSRLREDYFSNQNKFTERSKDNERAKHNLAILEHEIDHLKKQISEKTTEGESIQLSIKSFNREIKEVGDEIYKLDKAMAELRGKTEEAQKIAEKERMAVNEKIEEVRKKFYETKVKQSELSVVLRENERELERTELSLTETKTLLAKSKEEKFDNNLGTKLEEKEKRLIQLEKEIETIKKESSKVNDEAKVFAQKLLEKERAVHDLERSEAAVRMQINDVELEKARYETKLESLYEEMKLFKVEVKADQKLEQHEKDLLRARIENLRRKKDSISSLDPETIQEYEESEKRLTELSTQLEDLERAKEDLEKLIKELDRKISYQFSNTFKSISERFQKYFALLFEGGKANLILDHDEESGELGIEITANPPGKKVQSLSMLSGGERTLTSLALVFAILSINPSPFCILDEVDAALDEANTLRFVKILKDLDKKTQFIVITHNRETMRVANYLYGLTMNEEHISKLFSIKLAEAYQTVN